MKNRLLKILKYTAVTMVAVMALASFVPVAAQVYTAYAALDGSVSAPSYAFNSATNTGLSRDAGSGAAQMSVNGSLVQRWLSGGPVVAGQLRSNSSKPPTVNGSNTIVGTDTAMIVTAVGAPASIVVTFGNTWAAAPACFVATNRAASQAENVATTTTAVTLTAATTFTGQAATFGTDTIGVFCIGN